MQADFIKAFRQRLVRAGFMGIAIFDEHSGRYLVYCTDPNGKRIRVRLTKEQIMNTPKVVWFDQYTTS